MKSSDLMRSVVEWFGSHPSMRPLFAVGGYAGLRMIYPLQYLLVRELLDCDSVLDLGCGRHSMVPILPRKTRTVGVELFRPHYELAVQSKRHTQYLNEDVTRVSFEERSFDAVVMLDVLEHLSKEEGRLMIEKMRRWARKKVVIFTPNGFVHQDEYAENPYMEHRSGWTAAEMRALGYRVWGVRGFKKLRKDDHEHEHSEARVSWVNRLADMTQLVTYHWPDQAYQLFCVQTIQK